MMSFSHHLRPWARAGMSRRTKLWDEKRVVNAENRKKSRDANRAAVVARELGTPELLKQWLLVLAWVVW